MSSPENQVALKVQADNLKLNQDVLQFGPTGLPIPDPRGFMTPVALTLAQRHYHQLFAKVEAEKYVQRHGRQNTR